MVRPKPVELLRDAIEAGRAALRDLEPDQIPPRLRRVAAYSGGTLPPPLATSLLAELDTNPMLRDQALEALGGDGPRTAGADVSRAFLDRSGPWIADVIEAALGVGARHAEFDDRRLSLERDSLQAEVAALKERLRRERIEADSIERGLQADLEEARRPRRNERLAEEKTADALARERDARASVEEALTAELEAARSEIARWQEEARRQRLARAEEREGAHGTEGGGWPATGPDLARHLDELAARVTARVAPPDPGLEAEIIGVPAALQPPVSVRPDTAEAIDWMIVANPDQVVVDGYNVGFMLGRGVERARALATEVTRRVGAACPAAHTVVVFDGREQLGASVATRTGSTEIAFSEGERADEEIVRRVAAVARSVVVTNDRELRQRVEAEGAVALWSDALVEWSRRR